MSILTLEQRINSLEVNDGETEAELLIEECFEHGFFPWDNPKFQAFLVHTVEINLQSGHWWGRRSTPRGWVFAQTALSLLAHQPQYDYLAQSIKSLVQKPSYELLFPSVQGLVELEQSRCDRKLARSLRAAKRRTGAA